MQYFVVFAHKGSLGSGLCTCSHQPPTLEDVRWWKEEIRKIHYSKDREKPLIINFLPLSDS